jgi:hypothetical protein
MTEPAPTPDGLHARGSRLWAALGQTLGTAAGEVALEACRTADRLDELDRIIAGKGVLNLMQFRLRELREAEEDGRAMSVEVKFQNVLAEARQQAGRFAALITALGIDAAPARTDATEEASPLAAVLALVQPGAKSSGRPSKG